MIIMKRFAITRYRTLEKRDDNCIMKLELKFELTHEFIVLRP